MDGLSPGLQAPAQLAEGCCGAPQSQASSINMLMPVIHGHVELTVHTLCIPAQPCEMGLCWGELFWLLSSRICLEGYA